MKSTFLTAREVASLLSVTTKTIQRWDREGILESDVRSPTNRRLYSQQTLERFIQKKVEDTAVRVVGYARVSSRAQKPDLANQEKLLREYGGPTMDIVAEIGGGLNFKRKRFLELIDAIERNEVGTLVVAHKDRLTRFGFDFFERFASKHGCSIVVLNKQEMSPEQEMVQDLMTIIHCFSSRLYGLRNYKRSIKKALSDESIQD